MAAATASGLEVTRTAASIARDGNDCLSLFFNTANRPLSASQGGQHVTLAPGELLLHDMGAPNVTGAPVGGDALLIYIARQRLGAALSTAEAHIMRKLDAQAAPFALLRTYATALVKCEGEISGPAGEVVENHLTDLLLLGLGINGDDSRATKPGCLATCWFCTALSIGWNSPGVTPDLSLNVTISMITGSELQFTGIRPSHSTRQPRRMTSRG